jgi:hypothetical protein
MTKPASKCLFRCLQERAAAVQLSGQGMERVAEFKVTGTSPFKALCDLVGG